MTLYFSKLVTLCLVTKFLDVFRRVDAAEPASLRLLPTSIRRGRINERAQRGRGRPRVPERPSELELRPIFLYPLQLRLHLRFWVWRFFDAIQNRIFSRLGQFLLRRVRLPAHVVVRRRA